MSSPFMFFKSSFEIGGLCNSLSLSGSLFDSFCIAGATGLAVTFALAILAIAFAVTFALAITAAIAVAQTAKGLLKPCNNTVAVVDDNENNTCNSGKRNENLQNNIPCLHNKFLLIWNFPLSV
jgi:hypothetical protein